MSKYPFKVKTCEKTNFYAQNVSMSQNNGINAYFRHCHMVDKNADSSLEESSIT